jgi:hypothetical protein
VACRFVVSKMPNRQTKNLAITVSNSIRLLDVGFDYPQQFHEIANRKLLDLEPWVIMEGEYLEQRYQGLQERYPSRRLIPFARRIDNDDLACWIYPNNSVVVIIHDFASPGWEQREEFDGFLAWFKKAVEDMINRIEEDVSYKDNNKII